MSDERQGDFHRQQRPANQETWHGRSVGQIYQGVSSPERFNIMASWQLMVCFCTFSLDLSKQGKALAGEEPYLIQSGPYQELVISQPRHIQDFYRNDAKGNNDWLNKTSDGVLLWGLI